MKIHITVPSAEEIFHNSVELEVTYKGQQWSESQLGPHAKDTGVYVIHHAGSVKYVGMMEKPRMSFGMRLRREFTEDGSQGRHIFPKLAQLQVPLRIRVSFLGRAELPKLVQCSKGKIDDERLAAIFEQVLIQTLSPEFQT